MEKLELKNLFEAIKKDDLKSFSSVMLSNSDLNICFGRFPILSLCYLYGSYKILEKYEKLLLPIHNFVFVDEYYEIYLKFKKHAKKSLKLFVYEDKIVYPVEMLAVLDERYLLIKYYKKLYKNEEIVLNLKKIYKINKQIDLDASLQECKIEPKKLGFKQKLFAAVCVFVLAFAISISSVSLVLVKSKFGMGTAQSPIKISTEKELQKALKSGKLCYVLENDIVLTKEFDSTDFGGVIYGGGHKLVAGGFLTDGFVENLTGTVQDLTIESGFENKSILQNFAILAKYSSGNVKNCKIIGDFSFETHNDSDVYISLFVAENDGVISNCEVSCSATVKNSRSSNVFLSAFAGINDGKVEKSKTNSGKFSADTVDVGGIVCTNNGEVFECENNVSVVQVSDKMWHPNSAGICITNNGTISNSKNHAEISAESKLETAEDGQIYYVFAGGVACDNYGFIERCYNSGKIIAKSIVSMVYAGGIASMNSANETQVGKVHKSLSECDLNANSEKKTVYVGGVIGSSASFYYSTLMGVGIVNMSEIVNCGFVGKIETNSSTAFAAGVVAYNVYAMVKDCYSGSLFENKSTSKDNEFFAALVSGTMTLQYLENNHYVVDGSFETGVYFLQSFGSMINVTPIADASAGAVAHENFSEIPQEVKLK